MDYFYPTLVVSAAIFWFFLYVLIGGSLLRASIGLYNRICDSNDPPTYIPEPRIRSAFGIVFASILICLIVVFVAGHPLPAHENVYLFIFSASLIIALAGILYMALPTTLGRAVWVATCHFTFSLLVLVIIAILEFFFLQLG